MKFSCDRCQARYSISDERVRGKILKIRCKSCANVITVREGMEAEAPERGHRPTTMAPSSTVGSGGVAPSAPAPAPTLGAAFASAMSAQAPSKLEDEWYVSRDGDQQGPFGLANAKAWVSQQPYDAELYCWCEGFDDWLPVDRIAHFRGLRPRPAPPAVPLAAPSAASAPARAAAALPSLGTQPSPAAASPAAASPSPAAASQELRPRATQLGAAASPAALRSASAQPAPAEQPLFAASMAALGTDGMRPAPAPQSGGLARPAVVNGSPPSPFDEGDLGNEGFSADASASGLRAAPGALPSPMDDELEFGEVSRVVRIADIGKARSGPVPRTPAAPQPWAPPAQPAAGTGAAPALLGPGLEPGPVEVPLAMPAAQQRKHALLLGLVAAALVGAALVALLLLQGGDDEQPSMLAVSGRDVTDLTIRPDDPRRPSAGSGATTPETPTSPSVRPIGVPRRPPSTGSNPGTGSTSTGGGKVETTPPPKALTALGGDEVEEMSQRNSGGLNRCYEQALKKDIFLEVKSIKITISIDASGSVTGVQLSSHADHALGTCMIARIRAWRFRPNLRGLDAKFTVAFART
ncbi:MAG: GYF domain-containing protein [Kofleriaceae bacterium]